MTTSLIEATPNLLLTFSGRERGLAQNVIYKLEAKVDRMQTEGQQHRLYVVGIDDGAVWEQ